MLEKDSFGSLKKFSYLLLFCGTLAITGCKEEIDRSQLRSDYEPKKNNLPTLTVNNKKCIEERFENDIFISEPHIRADIEYFSPYPAIEGIWIQVKDGNKMVNVAYSGKDAIYMGITIDGVARDPRSHEEITLRSDRHYEIIVYDTYHSNPNPELEDPLVTTSFSVHCPVVSPEPTPVYIEKNK